MTCRELLAGGSLALLATAPATAAEQEADGGGVEQGAEYMIEIALDAFERPELRDGLSAIVASQPEWLRSVVLGEITVDPDDPFVVWTELQFNVAPDAPVGESGRIVIRPSSGDAQAAFDTDTWASQADRA